MRAKSPYPLKALPNGAELSRLINAAVVSSEFCELLLSNPEVALSTGYNGEFFHLAPEEWEWVISTHATSLADFASQLTNGRNRRGNSQ